MRLRKQLRFADFDPTLLSTIDELAEYVANTSLNRMKEFVQIVIPKLHK